MKKYVVPILILCLAMILCSFAVAELSYPFDTTVSTDQVNLRRSATSGAAVLATLGRDDVITVTGESGSYYAVNYEGIAGYILKTYVYIDTLEMNAIEEESKSIATATPETAEKYPYDTTTKVSVNLRARKTTSSALLKKIPAGATISVQAISGSWAQVTYKTYTGYVKKEYINVKTIVRATATPKPTATPAPTSPVSSEESYTTLQSGSSGSAVKALQSALTELGFYSGKKDGIFGEGTETALIAFQSANGYPTTGIADPNLQAFLYNDKPKNSNGKATKIYTLAPIACITVTLNCMGEQVEQIQTILIDLGYYTGSVTGVYDNITRAAMKKFQAKHGISATGKVESLTWAALLSDDALAVNQTPTPKPTSTPKPTASPTPEPTFQVPTAKVQRGSSGDNAKLVQQRLKDLEYYTGKVDGKFGSASVTALKAFQRKNGLTADGVAGTSTYDVLFSTGAISANATPTPALTAEPTPTASPVPTVTATYPPITEASTIVVKLNVTGDVVTRLQERLTALGYYQATVDGVCKADDVAAIKTFQSKNKLTVDGAAGYQTQVLLYSPRAIMASGAMAGGNIDSFATLRKGANGAEVTALQNRLKELGYYTGKITGIYDSATVTAVTAFQKNNNLTRDGIAGPSTLAKIYSASAAAPTATPAATATPQPTAAGTVSPSTTLKRGDSSTAVKQMQERLIALGYLTGKADGKFGYKTYLALIAFQRANSLKADGIAGAATLAKLNSSGAVGVSTATPAATATAAPTATPTIPTPSTVRASQVKYENWYTTIKSVAKSYPYVTVYDYKSGYSWNLHIFSVGAHADSEPVTAADTANMLKAFGGATTWTPKAVWVIFSNGSVYLGSTHDVPHEVQHNTSNNFAGHTCVHFPRTAAQVAAIGPYATSHQAAIDAAWAAMQ